MINATVWNAFLKVAAQWPDDAGVKLTLALHEWLVLQHRRLPSEQTKST
jgi:hypothetical protein